MSRSWIRRFPEAGGDREPGLTVAYRLSAALAILLFVAAVVGLFVPGLYKDTPLWTAQARGVNLIDLVIALPTLVASMLFSAAGSQRARIVWLGVLGYVLYNEVIFAFDIAFNPLFLVYVALLSLATFSLILGLTTVEVAGIRRQFSSNSPIRRVSVYLVIVAALFFLAWMKDIIPAIINDTTPTTIAQAKVPSNPVYVLDLGFLIPLYILSAVWLFGRRAWGYLLAGILLVLNALLGLSIISSTVFQYVSDPSTSLAVVPMFGIISGVSIVLTIGYLSSLRGTSL